MKIQTFDTTLRDGTQGEAVSFSVEDKLAIAKRLDDLGIDYIEGGWPMSNPKDTEFFARARGLHFEHAKLTAFGSTRLARNAVDRDANVRALVEAQTPVVSIFGKSWDLHVRRALGISEEENLAIIADTVRHLKGHGREVVYDAEHFFDGYLADASFALRTLEAAKNAGADVLCLCDTRGGVLTDKLAEIVAVVRKRFDGVLGIHPHNDSEVAVANALAAVREGCSHVQGCLNGYGERCGNANLASVIVNLELKRGDETIGPENLAKLTAVSRFIAEKANLPLPHGQPYVGSGAFAHKGGIHVSAVRKDAATYEHVSPEIVGNRQRVLLSDLSGKGNLLHRLEELGLAARLDDTARKRLLDEVKRLEHEGYDLESADGTFELLARQSIEPDRSLFDLGGFTVTTQMMGAESSATVATVSLKADGRTRSTTASGNGPVHALDLALRKCLAPSYPPVSDVQLIDYKVRVMESRNGTGSRVRVLVEWHDRGSSWTTMGISGNIIEASWHALVDALRLELMRLPEIVSDLVEESESVAH
ncbi:MAG: citramalate synthase [Acidobacteria bacterium]|nr:citramalate synthase [Acidobacteriota bacterium]